MDGTTKGTYRQLIRTLDMDQRPEEAHKFWKKKISMDLHAVLWELCKSMISIYYRNNMLENLVKALPDVVDLVMLAFESFLRGWKLLIVNLHRNLVVIRRVADAYEILVRLEKKERVLKKYNLVITEET